MDAFIKNEITNSVSLHECDDQVDEQVDEQVDYDGGHHNRRVANGRLREREIMMVIVMVKR